MRKLRWMLLTSTLLLSNSIFAAAFQFYELGTPIIGTAGVGQAAVAEDASTAYFNPAGMTQLQSSQLLLGTQLIFPFNNFYRNNNNTIFGDNGGNAGTLTPGLGGYYVYNYSSDLKAGISLTSPYGGMLNYNNGWVGRYVVQSMELFTLDINPVLAYRVNKWFSLGLGPVIEYANLHETQALPVPITPLIDGQANLKVSNTAAGFNLGVLLTPSQTTKLGIAYRSKITHDLTGDITFLRIAATPSTSTKMVMPQNIIMSLSQGFNNFTLLGELGWSNWATMRNTIVNVDGFTATTPRNWNNTYRVGLGGQYNLTSAWLLQAGASFDSSPTNTTNRLPDLPMDRQIRVGAGVMYSVMKAMKVGFSYEYINFGNAPIDNTSSTGTLAGSYSRNFANVLQASINISC